jgi:hypothetical protein
MDRMSSEGTPIVTESCSCFRFLPCSPLGIPISDLPDLRSGFDPWGSHKQAASDEWERGDQKGANRPHATIRLSKRTWDKRGTNIYESDPFDFVDLRFLEPGSIPAASTIYPCWSGGLRAPIFE